MITMPLLEHEASSENDVVAATEPPAGERVDVLGDVLTPILLLAVCGFVFCFGVARWKTDMDGMCG
jgi:hypothetical protein